MVLCLGQADRARQHGVLDVDEGLVDFLGGGPEPPGPPAMHAEIRASTSAGHSSGHPAAAEMFLHQDGNRWPGTCHKGGLFPLPPSDIGAASAA